jgi:ribosomal protein S18 acetylase RimI-like enzyme
VNDLLLKLQTSLIEVTAQTRHTVVRPTFTALISLEATHPGLNYAVPTAPTSYATIEELVNVFEELGRMPRLEFFPLLWPDLPGQLAVAGFEREAEYPLMILPRDSWRSRESATANLIRPDEGVVAEQIAAIAFGSSDSLPSDGESTKKGVQSGRTLCALAQIEGQYVSTGFGIGDQQVREMAGIATLPEFRRRGAATAVLDCLLSRFFEDGGKVAWLSAGDDGAKTAYAKVGFVEAGVQANWSRPS